MIETGWTPRPKLPDFLIIGGQKCGTTSTLLNLAQHPDVFVPERWEPGSEPGEIHFFDKESNWARGVPWYASHFRDGLICGEKTPAYMMSQTSMRRVASVVPEARLIVCVRCPVRRFFSQVRMRVALGRPVDIHRAVENPEYIRRGLWYELLTANVLPYFPRDRVKILVVDTVPIVAERTVAGDKTDETQDSTVRDLSGVVRRQMQEVFEFLELDPVLDHLLVKNRGSEIDLDEHSVRQQLILTYRDDTLRLAELVGRDLDHWESWPSDRR